MASRVATPALDWSRPAIPMPGTKMIASRGSLSVGVVSDSVTVFLLRFEVVHLVPGTWMRSFARVGRLTATPRGLQAVAALVASRNEERAILRVRQRQAPV